MRPQNVDGFGMTAESLAPPLRSLEELALDENVLVELVVRRILVDTKSSFEKLSRALGLPPSIVETLLRSMRDRQLVDFERMVGLDWVVALTDSGRALASESSRRLAYVGTAPVNIESYRSMVAAQQEHPNLDREKVKAAFSDVVVRKEMLEEVGPAMMAGGAIFLYGAPGTGKTTIAERLSRLAGGPILVPRAIEIESQIITVFDPTVHKPVTPQPDIDPRWVLCERPAIVVGGDLTRSQMDLLFDQKTGINLAPIQLKANNGVLVIDDFGRQQMTPDELLNRWIVPMDRGIDYLTLSYGVRFDVPFNVRVVFSTNIDPDKLGDEAFFRRLPNKVHIGAVTADQFNQILYAVARTQKVATSADDALYLQYLALNHGARQLLPYLPAVICGMAQAICRYDGERAHLGRALLDRIAGMFFTNVDPSTRSPAPPVADTAYWPDTEEPEPEPEPSPTEVLERWLADQHERAAEEERQLIEAGLSPVAPVAVPSAPSAGINEWDKPAGLQAF